MNWSFHEKSLGILYIYITYFFLLCEKAHQGISQETLVLFLLCCWNYLKGIIMFAKTADRGFLSEIHLLFCKTCCFFGSSYFPLDKKSSSLNKVFLSKTVFSFNVSLFLLCVKYLWKETLRHKKQVFRLFLAICYLYFLLKLFCFLFCIVLTLLTTFSAMTQLVVAGRPVYVSLVLHIILELRLYMLSSYALNFYIWICYQKILQLVYCF